MRGEGPDAAPFAARIELLQSFLARRDDIVGRIAGLLNAQRRPVEYLQDRALQARQLEDCFFAQALTGAEPQLASTKRQRGERIPNSAIRAGLPEWRSRGRRRSER